MEARTGLGLNYAQRGELLPNRLQLQRPEALQDPHPEHCPAAVLQATQCIGGTGLLEATHQPTLGRCMAGAASERIALMPQCSFCRKVRQKQAGAELELHNRDGVQGVHAPRNSCSAGPGKALDLD